MSVQVNKLPITDDDGYALVEIDGILYRRATEDFSGGLSADEGSAIVERLDVLEANRSTSPAMRAELRSQVTGLTSDSPVSSLAPDEPFIFLSIRTPDYSVFANLFSGTLQTVIDDIGSQDPNNYLEALIEGGYFVIRPKDPSQPIEISAPEADVVIAAFQIDDTWFGQPVFPRAAGTYDTHSTAVRLSGPEGAYAPSSGLSVSTALEALKRLHHIDDRTVLAESFMPLPEGRTIYTVTCGDIGIEPGGYITIYLEKGSNTRENGRANVTSADQLLRDLIFSLPDVFLTDRRDVFLRSCLGFQVNLPEDLWDSARLTYVSSGGSPLRGSISRIPSRVGTSSIRYEMSVSYGGRVGANYETGLLSSLLAGMTSEIYSLRRAVLDLERRVAKLEAA